MSLTGALAGAIFSSGDGEAQGIPPPPPPPPPPPSGLLTTRTLENTSGSTQAGGFVAPKMGFAFKQGDIPSGYPLFKKTDGTVLAATIMNLSHHDDGSVFMCSAMVRWPDSIAGSGTATIEVHSGGSAPSASALDQTDITATDIKHELVGVTNLTGTWTAEANQGITDADFVEIGSGPAGASYRIRQEFNDGSSDHGQLRCWFYVDVLQDASGALAGLRYKTRPINGYADFATGADRVVVTSKVLEGASTRKTQQGYNTTETLGANINLPHYSSFFGCEDSGDSFFVAGTQAAECTTRVTLDTAAKEYLMASGAAMPWDLSLTPSATASVNYYPMALAPLVDRNNDHTGDSVDVGIIPAWQAKHFLSMAVNDERAAKVGSLNCGSWRQCARRAADESLIPVRNTGTWAGMTKQPTWFFAASSGSFSGFVAPATATSLWLGESTPSHRPEPHFYPYLMWGEQHSLDMLMENAFTIIAHTLPLGGTSPSTVKTSNPIVDSFINVNYGNRYVQVGATTYECVIMPFGQNANRWGAWAMRDVGHAWAAAPTTDPFGMDLRGYLDDEIEDVLAFNAAYTATRPATWADHGLHDFSIDGLGSSAWTTAYLLMTISKLRLMTGHRASVAAFHDHMCKLPAWLAANVDFAHAANFYQMNRTDVASGGGTYGARIEDLDDNLWFWSRGLISWDAGTNVFTIGPGGADNNLDFTPQNGDIVAFTGTLDGYTPPFAAAADRVKQYVVNVSGQTFQLAATPGGAAQDVTSTGSAGRIWARWADPSPSFSAHGRLTNSGADPGLPAYLVSMSIRYAHAAGGAGLTAALAAAEATYTAAGGLPTWAGTNLKWHVTSDVL